MVRKAVAACVSWAALLLILTVSLVDPANAADVREPRLVAAGSQHSLALSPEGQVWTWGYNDSGQLGDGGKARRYTPSPVKDLPTAAAVAANGECSLALDRQGQVWGWGSDLSGELGDGRQDTVALRPVVVKGLTHVVAIAMGGRHGLAIKNDGTVWGWGANGSGQVGPYESYRLLQAAPVPGVKGAVVIAAGRAHSLAVTNDGALFAWGSNDSGQLGTGDTRDPGKVLKVAGPTNVVAAAAGDQHSLALTKSGEIWAWGYNYHGQAGVANTEYVLRPTRVAGLAGVVQIAAGGRHSLALTAEGDVYAWGDNRSHALGEATVPTSAKPVKVLSGVRVIGSGRDHSLAVKTDGTVWAWGNNDYGQLGTGTNKEQTSPVKVGGLFGPEKAGAGDATLFTQGSGYAEGGYDRRAIQPTSANWSHLSRFNGPKTPEMVRFVDLCGETRSTPAIGADGTVYLAAGGPALLALWPSGKLKWEYPTSERAVEPPVIAQDGTIYFVTTNPDNGHGNFVAVLPNGSRKWEVALDGLHYSPVIGADGSLYVVSQNDVVALTPSGQQKWRSGDSKYGRRISAAPSIAADGTLYVPLDTLSGEENKWLSTRYPFPAVMALDPASGTPKRYYFLGGGSPASPTIAPNGTIYIAGGRRSGSFQEVDRVVGFGPADGKESWASGSFKVCSLGASPILRPDGMIYQAFGPSPIWAAGGVFGFKLADPNQYVSFAMSTKWNESYTPLTPVIGADGTIYASGHEALYAFDGSLQRGFQDPAWSYKMGTDLTTEPVIGAEGIIYVGAGSRLYLIGGPIRFPAEMSGPQLTASVSPSSLTLNPGESRNLSVTGNSRTPVISYTVDDPYVATVDAQGVVQGKNPGQTTVTVTATNTLYSGKVALKVPVTVRGTVLPTVKFLSVPEALYLEKGETAPLLVKTDPADAKLEYLVSKTDEAAIWVDQKGAVTVRGGSLHHVTVLASKPGYREAKVMVSVWVDQGLWNRPLSILGAPEQLTVAIGEAQALKLSSRPSGATFTYTVDDPTVAEVAADGLVIAKKLGKTTIRVAADRTWMVDEVHALEVKRGETPKGPSQVSFTTRANLTIALQVAQEKPAKEESGLQLILPVVALQTGQEHDLAPFGTSDPAVVAFASSDPNVAQVSSRGRITALKPGTATITVKITRPDSLTVIRLDVKVSG